MAQPDEVVGHSQRRRAVVVGDHDDVVPQLDIAAQHIDRLVDERQVDARHHDSARYRTRGNHHDVGIDHLDVGEGCFVAQLHRHGKSLQPGLLPADPIREAAIAARLGGDRQLAAEHGFAFPQRHTVPALLGQGCELGSRRPATDHENALRSLHRRKPTYVLIACMRIHRTDEPTVDSTTIDAVVHADARPDQVDLAATLSC